MLEDGCVLKCRRCRLSLVTGHSIVGSHGNSEACPMEGLSTLWYISDNHIPDWVQEQITQVQWTKGRLLCPKCAGRLGLFDFVSPVKCPCGDQVFPPIHIQRCRVDVDKLSPKHVPKTQQGEKLPLKMCETKEQACGLLLTSEHFTGGQLETDSEKGKRRKNSTKGALADGTGDAPARTGVTAAGTGDAPARTDDTPARTGVTAARTGVTAARTGVTAARTGATAARTGDAPTEKVDTHSELAEMDSSVSDAHVSSSSDSTSTSEEEESSDQTYTWTSVSSQRPLVVADDDDSCLQDTNLFQVLEGLDGGNTGSTADRRRTRRQTKRDRNKLKNIRKKQRRHEKWVKKQTQEEENFEEAEREGLICPICLDLYYEPYMCQPCGHIFCDYRTQEEENFEEAEREGLICPICLDLYYEPYMCQPCGHVFCDPCLRQIAKDNPGCTACPLCRTVVITVNFSYQLSKTMQEFFPRHHESRRRAERQSRHRSWPLPGVSGARALWWTTVTSLTSRRAGRNFPHYRSNDDDLNYDGSMFDELLVYFYSVNWVIGLFVVCGLCYFSIRSFIF
ncbi:PREDICTED: E3 ubiquitin-protein ligase RNF180-like [Branchiostoma belcheri]|uniref:E3 ubiquitin-protein ligase RNF180-like n=1 Tax=Branchiostoma belcheri TaxID=7741 RepID=A0A6P4YUD1_BRABE|nr:PREDICTED: E3 ubiquitin-protein ligase RNF180-like [Branchiostoma belcheri]